MFLGGPQCRREGGLTPHLMERHATTLPTQFTVALALAHITKKV